MLGGLTGWHLLILLAVVLLLFGAARLPALAKSVGQSARVFKKEINEMKDENPPTPGDGTSTNDASTTSTSDGQTGPTSSS
ncbi:MAG: twin-arginine translocase TatA/TatE family subunit [Microbacterium sp.]